MWGRRWELGQWGPLHTWEQDHQSFISSDFLNQKFWGLYNLLYLKIRPSDIHLLRFLDLKVLRLALWLRVDELMCELPVQKRKIFSKNLRDHHQPVRAVAGRLPDLLSAFIAALNERACSAREGPTPLQSFSLQHYFTFRLSALFFHMPCQSVTH